MNKYSVKDISEMLSTNQETVRRWIRDGILKGGKSSNKEGRYVLEADLFRFLDSKPKYAKILSNRRNGVATGTAAMELGAMLGSLAYSVVKDMKENSKSGLKAEEVKQFVNSTIKMSETTINKKRKEIEKLEADIAAEEELIKMYRKMLKQLDEKK